MRKIKTFEIFPFGLYYVNIYPIKFCGCNEYHKFGLSEIP